MPKYRIIMVMPERPRRFTFMTSSNSDEEMILEIQQDLQQRDGWTAEIWRPDRKLFIAEVSGPKFKEQ